MADMTTYDLYHHHPERKPVAATIQQGFIQIVVCNDGSIWGRALVDAGNASGIAATPWEEMEPIPGTYHAYVRQRQKEHPND